MVTRGVLCVLSLAFSTTAAGPIAAAQFKDTAINGAEVYVVLFHSGDLSDGWSKSWEQFAGSLGRCGTASVDLTAEGGKQLAANAGLAADTPPTIRVIKERAKGATDAALTLASDAAAPAVKQLRRALKKALAGCKRSSSGKFLKLDAVEKEDAQTCSAVHDHLYFAIRSQVVSHEAKMAARLQKELRNRGVAANSIVRLDTIISSWVDMETSGPPFHVDFWVLKPWLKHLLEAAPAAARWFVLLEPVTVVDVARLEAVLSGLDHTQKHFVGKAIADKHGSIVHAYSPNEDYVFPKTGFALSRALVEAAVTDSTKGDGLPVDTHIEVFFEFSRWMKKLGAPIADNAAFCAAPLPPPAPAAGAAPPAYAVQSGCATSLSPGGVEPFRTRHKLDPQDVIVAVKTTKMFHKDRLDVIRRTWAGASAPVEVVFLSDAEAAAGEPGPTVDLTAEWGKVVNQKKGHCAKTDAIMKHFEKHFGERQWFVIADDDTWFHLPRLLEVLATHDPAKPVYLGERYGYAHNGKGMGPYDYITMGGGMAMSRAALLARNECGDCTCLAPDTYDDMQVGKWFSSRLGIAAVHEEGFHQANPDHYHPLRLAHEELLSFHKFVNKPPPDDREIDVEKTVQRYEAELMANPSRKEAMRQTD